MSRLNNLLQRLELVKNIDPFNKQLLNDCYDSLNELIERNKLLEKQFYELAGTEQKL